MHVLLCPSIKKFLLFLSCILMCAGHQFAGDCSTQHWTVECKSEVERGQIYVKKLLQSETEQRHVSGGVYACQVTVTVGNSGLFCCVCVRSFECQLTP